ncbi:Uncharacterised protein [Candidatus Bilamarchaeum dharawalense]|uniref:DUF357 domain-containing protein n=1 Tax=Candidatus Bilamarchaeum dharawalense TaxID=2885759 RepID=A0A5E4LRS6_9ARCH|nr:Uncharacterised protein [Candidatus Bilamarchaeum dharawalense]
MNSEERAKKDIDKLDRIVVTFKKLKLDKKYPKVMEYVENYGADAKHFFEKGDYFTSFGAANYAYGFIDAVLVIEGKKDEIIL